MPYTIDFMKCTQISTIKKLEFKKKQNTVFISNSKMLTSECCHFDQV